MRELASWFHFVVCVASLTACGAVKSEGPCSSPGAPANLGDACNTCGGTIQCDGSCSPAAPSSFGLPCNDCGGTTQCDGSCSSTCPPCGGPGERCCASGCTTGGCQNGTCPVFGGIYQETDLGCPPCAPNPYAGGSCACAPGFVESETQVVQNYCNGNRFGSRLHLCAAPVFLPTSDWAGAYHVIDPCGGPPSCLTPNPYTGACGCPIGTTAINMRTTTGGCGGTIGSVLTYCWNPSAPRSGYSGSFQDQVVLDGAGQPMTVCRVPNPATGDCTCPAGVTQIENHVIADWDGPLRDARVIHCGRAP